MAPGGERRGGPESKDDFEGRDLLVAGPKGRRTGLLPGPRGRRHRHHRRSPARTTTPSVRSSRRCGRRRRGSTHSRTHRG